jgi:hypothetical protein
MTLMDDSSQRTSNIRAAEMSTATTNGTNGVKTTAAKGAGGRDLPELYK